MYAIKDIYLDALNLGADFKGFICNALNPNSPHEEAQTRCPPRCQRIIARRY